MSGTGDFQSSGGVGVQEQGSSGIAPPQGAGIPQDSGQAVRSQPDPATGAPPPVDEGQGLDESILSQVIAAGWKKPEDWAGFQAAKDREIHGIREQAIGFQQQARSAGHLASQWEEAYKALAAELGDENRYKLARADIYEQSQQVFAEEYQRASVNTEALEGQLRAATNYVKEHAYDSETGQKLFEPNDPEIRAAIGEVMQATRAQLMASSPQEQMQAGQALDTASAKVRALVRQRETRGYRKLYGTQAAEANRQQHQQNGPMVTPQGAAVGGGNLSFKQRRDQIAQANPNWSDEQIFEATMVGDIEASLRQG